MYNFFCYGVPLPAKFLPALYHPAREQGNGKFTPPKTEGGKMNENITLSGVPPPATAR